MILLTSWDIQEALKAHDTLKILPKHFFTVFPLSQAVSMWKTSANMSSAFLEKMCFLKLHCLSFLPVPGKLVCLILITSSGELLF